MRKGPISHIARIVNRMTHFVQEYWLLLFCLLFRLGISWILILDSTPPNHNPPSAPTIHPHLIFSHLLLCVRLIIERIFHISTQPLLISPRVLSFISNYTFWPCIVFYSRKTSCLVLYGIILRYSSFFNSSSFLRLFLFLR